MTTTQATPNRAELQRQLNQLDTLIAEGVLQGSEVLARRGALAAKLATAAPLDTSSNDAVPTGADVAATKPPLKLMLGVLAFVVLFGSAGYAWRGNPAGLQAGPGQTAPEPNAQQIMDMVAGLATKLESRPDDVQGWTMLARSYAAMSSYAEAEKAYAHLIKIAPQDADARADYADVLGMVAGGSLKGQAAEEQIGIALKLDPANGKALALAGSMWMERGQHAKAVAQWELALKQLEPGSEMARNLGGAIAEARQRAGMSASPTANAEAAAKDTPVSDKNSAKIPAPASIGVQVRLDASLASKASPDDTLFVFARAVSGSKIPLAIQRRKVGDLPLTLTLDESMAMNPALNLSTVREVVVGARISKSGNAMPQSGDLQGFSEPVQVGAKGLVLTIRDLVP